jgi:hypothetical protein
MKMVAVIVWYFMSSIFRKVQLRWSRGGGKSLWEDKQQRKETRCLTVS